MSRALADDGALRLVLRKQVVAVIRLLRLQLPDLMASDPDQTLRLAIEGNAGASRGAKPNSNNQS